MDAGKIEEVTQEMLRHLRAENIQAQRFPHDVFPHTPQEMLSHARYMLEEILTQLLPADRTEKAFRWLGFAQACCWAGQLFTIEVLKELNRP